MISHQYKAIFIHQRKCAGNTIMDAFGVPLDDPCWHYMNDGVLCPEHYYARMALPEYYRFSVVRNPWDRFVSGWLYCENLRDLPILEVLKNLPKFNHDYVHLTRLQSAILYERTGQLVTRYLIRFENLQADFDRVCDAIHKPRVELKKLNAVHGRRPYQEYFDDPEARDLFEKFFYRDLYLFDYKF